MQATLNIFGIWPTFTELATDISVKPDTVRKWKKSGRIPQESWQSVIEAARRRGHLVTVESILAFNTPMKRRGRPLKKYKRKPPAEARAG